MAHGRTKKLGESENVFGLLLAVSLFGAYLASSNLNFGEGLGSVDARSFISALAAGSLALFLNRAFVARYAVLALPVGAVAVFATLPSVGCGFAGGLGDRLYSSRQAASLDTFDSLCGATLVADSRPKAMSGLSCDRPRASNACVSSVAAW